MPKPAVPTFSEPPEPGPGQALSSGSNLQLPPDPVWSDDGHTVTDAKGQRYTRLSSSTEHEGLSANVRALPITCKGPCRNWWSAWDAHFGSKIRTRGSEGENGRNWVFGQFVVNYCNKFHPKLTPDERCEYETVLGAKIYWYMFNSHKRGPTKVEREDNDDNDIQGLGYKGPMRVTPQYLWQKENGGEVKRLLEEYFNEHPAIKRTAGQRNSAVQKLYKSKVPEQDKLRYKAMVDEENQNIKAGIRLEGEALSRYHKQLPVKLQKALDSAHAIGGVHILLTMVHEVPERPGEFQIHAINTEDMKPFQKDKSVGKAMTAMREFVRQSQGKSTGGVCGPPPPEVYPNRRGAWEPRVPNPEGLRAFELLDINRSYWKLSWAYMGGDCRFPWAEIARNPRFWLGVGSEELPGPFGDPSSLSGPINKTWVGFFYGHQTGTDLVSQPVFLRRILAVNPIDPSESEEVSRERYTYNGQEVWLVTFDKPVSKSHARNMKWTSTSIEYADFVENGRTTALLMASNPLGLPVAASSQTNKVLIQDEMLNDIKSHTDQLSDDAESKITVLELVRGYNDYATHLPAETPKGGWSGVPTPLILPAKPTAIFNILRKLFLPTSYVQSVLQATKEGTLSYAGAWLELIGLHQLFWHEKSSTLLGGETGVIWAVVLLVLLAFNFDYARGDVPLPAQLPENYDISRLPASEGPRVLEWCRTLTRQLRESEAILRESSPQRLRIAPPASGTSRAHELEFSSSQATPPQPSDDDLPPVVVPKPAPTAKPTKRTKAQKSSGKKSPRRKPKPLRRKSSGSESEAEFSDQNSDEENYEEEGTSGSDTSEDSELGDFAGGENSTFPADDSFRAPSLPAPFPQEDSLAPDDTTALFSKHSSTRKGFNSSSKGKKDEGYMPLIQDATLQAADCPWGRFPDPVINVTLPSPLLLESLKPRMESTLVEMIGVLRAWRKAVEGAEIAQAECCRTALAMPNPAAGDPDLGPLVATVRAREAMWNLQKAQGKELFPLLEQLSVVSMTAVHFSLAAAELIKRSPNLIKAGIQDASVWQKFAKFDQGFRTRIAEGRWIVEEMEDYALLATQMRKKIDWFPDSDKRPTFDKPAMRELALLCIEWTEATAKLEEPMLKRRRKNWSTSGMPFPTAHHEPNKYKFGNAEKQEWHRDLEACLERVISPAPTSTPEVAALTSSASTALPVARRQSPESASGPSASPPAPHSDPSIAASDIDATTRSSTTFGKIGTQALSAHTTTPTLGCDDFTVAAAVQATPEDEEGSSSAAGPNESADGNPKTAGPTDVTMSEPEPDPRSQSAPSSPAPVPSTSSNKAPKVKIPKRRATKTALPLETPGEVRQTRSAAKRKVEEGATVKRRTRSKK